jgi:hypothetical protein
MEIDCRLFQVNNAQLLNKERADPALIIRLITAAYEGFQTP